MMSITYLRITYVRVGCIRAFSGSDGSWCRSCRWWWGRGHTFGQRLDVDGPFLGVEEILLDTHD